MINCTENKNIQALASRRNKEGIFHLQATAHTVSLYNRNYTKLNAFCKFWKPNTICIGSPMPAHSFRRGWMWEAINTLLAAGFPSGLKKHTDTKNVNPKLTQRTHITYKNHMHPKRQWIHQKSRKGRRWTGLHWKFKKTVLASKLGEIWCLKYSAI